MYRRLHLDNAAPVRVAAAKALGEVASGAGRGLGKHLKLLAPWWWCAASDPNAEVRTEVRAAFERVFPTDAKRRGALLFASAEIIDAAVEQLKIRTPAEMPHREGTEEEQRERHERALTMALGALGTFAREAFTPEDEEKDDAANASAASNRSASVSAAERLGSALDETRRLRSFVKSPAPALRRAAYAALHAVSTGASSARLLADDERRIAIARVALVDAWRETDPSAFRDARELSLGYLHARPEPSRWSDVDPVTETVPALVEHLASGCHGDASASAPSLLPLLSLIPAEALSSPSRPESTEGGTPIQSFLGDILAACWSGWEVCCTPSRAADATALLRATREGFLYGVIVAARDENVLRAESFCEGLARTIVTERWAPEALARVDPNASSGSPTAAARDTLCEMLATLEAKPEAATAAKEAWRGVAAAAEIATVTRDEDRGARVDPPGAARARAFRAALVAAARARNGARGVSDASSTGWVGAKFAAPLLAATTAASSSFDRAHATLIASFVEAHGAACLPGGDARALAARCLETSRSSKTTDAGFEPATDAAATVLAALSRAAPETWDETLDALAAPGEDAAERRRALAAILEKLEDTFDERGVDERSADRVVASRWRAPRWTRRWWTPSRRAPPTRRTTTRTTRQPPSSSPRPARPRPAVARFSPRTPPRSSRENSRRRRRRR